VPSLFGIGKANGDGWIMERRYWESRTARGHSHIFGESFSKVACGKAGAITKIKTFKRSRSYRGRTKNRING